ncbi:TrkH family potassium uptake protein [Reinekea blandensis]|uniref:Trk system potassium uptake protein n=1 Tax=Reinekea blandensis MED297 TaxID=314283 RepID=A4BK85_9GAMM|nr:TrkH family potassium uptake protein [Reinekea blandensis]EAR07452.1 Trk-type K+ transport system, membrane component [Reinekea sp. MED297] [Reinekea blandensis MED297]
MQFRLTLKILGLLLMVFSLSMLPSVLVSLYYHDGAHMAFILAFLLVLMAGFIMWLPVRRWNKDLRTRDGFVITVMFWLVLGVAGSVPLSLAPSVHLSYTDAFFESFSGLTTTGATVITGIDNLPQSVQFYRQQLQWLGGMGIIVLAVAVLPMLGIGGMQLYRAETPGPMKDSKLTPRIAETAKALWYIYLTLTIVCALAYWLAGMTVFDAVAHSFSTVAIGGFSTHDASIGFFDSAAIEMIAVLFMLLSSANFALHYVAWNSKSIKQYLIDPEYSFFLIIALVLMVVTVFVLWVTQTYDVVESTRYGIFEAVSLLTTTGFGTADFSTWPLFAPFMLFMASFIGGCAGSTAGGMKVVRVMLILKQGLREIKRLIHPAGVFPVKVGHRKVSDKVVESVWGFFSVYIMAYAVIFFGLLATGLDFETTWSAVGSSLNNLGPGLGEVAAHYGSIPDTAKWLLCFAMLLGRLEIFTLLVMLTPQYWRS